MSQHQGFTEGARRALDLAQQLAAGVPVAVQPLHLLQALILDESRAAAIMAGQGLTRFALDASAAVQDLPTSTQNSPRGQGCQESAHSKHLNSHQASTAEPAIQQIVDAASSRARLGGRESEVGSEHLLWGLSAVASKAADILHQFGLNVDHLTNQVERSCGIATEPIAVDFSIDWQDEHAVGQTDVYRILDAAANRAREGLRVVEDFTRFTLDDAHLTRELKETRHQLAELLSRFRPHDLLSVRDTERDVGTDVRTRSERMRVSPIDVLQANFKRIQEALRTLEEYGKLVTFSGGNASTDSCKLDLQLEQLRYQTYSLEKALLQTHRNLLRLEGRQLYLLLTAALCRNRFDSVLERSIAGGVGVVQLREKEMSDRELLETSRRVRRVTRDAGVLFILNDRPDVALLSGADGVHIGQDELPVREARRIVGPERMIGVSTHTIAQARRAVLDGADYIGVGPVFGSATKKFAELAGLGFVRAVSEEIQLPWYAIGGIKECNLQAVRDAGADRIAVSQAICGAERPDQAARQLVGRLAETARR